MSNEKPGSSKTPSGLRQISRRDFLHDVSIASLGLALPSVGVLAEEHGAASTGDGEYYPPSLTGLRGSHPGAFEAAHRLAREGKGFPEARETGEHYDLVIVGAGISGLSAAYFYRQRFGHEARILLLDNHDDFGGHAKRNEFHGDETHESAMKLAWGGTVNIEYENYSPEGRRLLAEIGVDVQRLYDNFTYNWADNGTGLGTACWFDEATYGRDVLIPELGFRDFSRERLLETLDGFPISESAKTALRDFLISEAPVREELSAETLDDYIHSTRYADFLHKECGLPEEVLQIFRGSTQGVWGVAADDLSVAECLESGLPGAHRLNLPDAADGDEAYPPSAMFPDGNASIARLLVRALIPAAFPNMTEDSDPFDIVTSRLDYTTLDNERSPTRLRLNSTVINVGNNEKGGVDISYLHAEQLQKITADQCVLACYNRIIPHLCPELPEAQKAGLRECIKRPMLTINVALKNGQAIADSGIASAYLPGSMLQMVSLVTGISTGDYNGDWDPDQPCVLHFFSKVTPETYTGASMSDQDKAGRLRLLGMRFEDFEDEVFRTLEGIWGPSGLRPERDVTAITVNRWPHGYARDLLDMEDSAWLASPGPYEIGRQPFGQIAIANSDAGADAYTHTAIDQAWRAVGELAERRSVTPKRHHDSI
ncbi:MAG: NAD(P)/FAD-dependent oxidoreductase [Congregibacter sp.]